ncbi:MAG TPA: hypothetical protein VF515_05150 [Candidatus Binatia bacterium]
MSNILQIFLMPAFGGALAGTLSWPAIGAVFAWLLILSLLGDSSRLEDPAT